MYAEERQRVIVNLALRHERVSVTELAERFDVTTETIRRDLDALDRRGILRRVHNDGLAHVTVAAILRCLQIKDAPAYAALNRLNLIDISNNLGDSKSLITDPATTTPNSLNKRPVRPLRKMMGRNTAAKVMVVLTMAKVISFDPSWPAFMGSMPPSILL